MALFKHRVIQDMGDLIFSLELYQFTLECKSKFPLETNLRLCRI